MLDPQEQTAGRRPQAAQSDTHTKAASTPPPPSLRAVGDARAVEWQHIAATVAAVVAIHLLPRLVLGQNSYVSIHDNIESDLSYRVLIARDHRLFSSDAVVTELLGGLPRWVFPPPYKLSSIMFWLLKPFFAYVALETIVSGVAVLGMALLLRDYVRPTRVQCLAIAAIFGILPFYFIYDLTVAGEPLIAWALLNLWRDRHSAISLAICAAFPFASVLFTGTPFFLLMAGIVVVVAAIRARRVPWRAGTALLLIGVGFLIADRPYLAGLLRAEFVSYRAAWRMTASTIPLRGLPYAARALFLEGRYHAASLHTPILGVTLGVAPLLWLRGHRREAGVLLLVVVIGGLFAMSGYLQVLRVMDPVWRWWPFLRQVNPRFWWSLPLLWYVGLGFLALYWSRAGLPNWLLNGVLVLQFAWVFYAPTESGVHPAEPELRRGYLSMVERLRGNTPRDMGFEEFLSAPVFDQIRKHVGEGNTGRFLSIGMHPGLAAMSGLPCADGIHDNYPLAYKNRFRRLVAGELAHDGKNRRFFDDYGIRVYVLLRQFRKINARPKRPPMAIQELSLNEDALHDLGVEWILSAVELEGNARLPFFIDHGVFSDPRAAYTIHLYRVRDRPN